MAASIGNETIRIDGLKQLQNNLLKAGDGVTKDAMKQANKDVGQIVVAEAMSLVPRRTGALAATIKPVSSPKNVQVRAGTGKVVYAGPIHFGWPRHNIRPQPFLFHAVGAKAQEILEAYDKNVSKILNDLNLTDK